jgi:hypothetical protein
MHRLATAIMALNLATIPAMAKTQKTAPHSLAQTDICTNANERTAFDTEGLKSELMVLAETCHLPDKYNGFIRTYQPTLAAEEKDLNTYFKRSYGRSSDKAHDDYITNLANVQSQEGLKSGTAFCQLFENMFDEVMSLHDGSELADYAHSQAIVQPLAFTTCSEVPVKVLSKPRHKAARHKST